MTTDAMRASAKNRRKTIWFYVDYNEYYSGCRRLQWSRRSHALDWQAFFCADCGIQNNIKIISAIRHVEIARIRIFRVSVIFSYRVALIRFFGRVSHAWKIKTNVPNKASLFIACERVGGSTQLFVDIVVSIYFYYLWELRINPEQRAIRKDLRRFLPLSISFFHQLIVPISHRNEEMFRQYRVVCVKFTKSDYAWSCRHYLLQCMT